MTEQDTFDCLRRTPRVEVMRRYDNWWATNPKAWRVEDADAVLAPHGWTYHDLCIPPKQNDES